MRILTVDDSRVFRKIIGTELKPGGYEVVEAESGPAALELLQEESFDLITLDVEMPPWDGYETCRRLREASNLARGNTEVPVVFVTGTDDIEGRHRGFAVGGTDFIHKRFQKGDLRTAIDRLLRPDKRFAGLNMAVVVAAHAERTFVSTALRRLGVSATTYSSYAELNLEESNFDLIFGEEGTEAGSGVALCREFTTSPRFAGRPFIVLVDGRSELTALDFYSAGASDAIHKPCIIEELLARISVHLETRLLQRSLNEYNRVLEERVREATAEIRAQNILLERRVEDLGHLNRAAASVSSELEPHALLKRVLELSQKVMRAGASAVFSYDADQGLLSTKAATGTHGDQVVGRPLSMESGVAGWVARNREIAVIADAYSDERFDPELDKQTGFVTKSMLAAPIIYDEELLGVIEVLNKENSGTFDAYDIELFLSFSRVVSLALRNARMFQAQQKMSGQLRDALEAERNLAIEKRKMGAYMPKHVVDEISANREKALALGGRVVEATVMFADIEGFTRLSEHMAPEAVVDFLNEFMTAMTEVIESHDGVIDKFMGDGIMAVFLGGGKDSPHHAARAVQAAIEMQRRIGELRDDWVETRPNVAHMRIRVGVNTGKVVAGNIGSRTRMDYTVIGDNANVAARLETAAGSGEVLISQATYLSAGEVEAQMMPPLPVKNRQQPVSVYKLRLGL